MAVYNSDSMANNLNLTQTIYCQLKEEIFALRLIPGEKLSEMKIAAQYNCSRIPVREAFRQLCMEGCLESRPQIGSFVTLIDRVRLEQIRYVRECLETRVMVDGMREGCFYPLLDKLQEIVNTQALLYKNREYAHLHRLDNDFHNLFYEAAEKDFVRDYMGIENADYARARFISLKYDNEPELLIQQHQDIVDAVRKNDEEKLCSAMRAHLNNLYRVLPICPVSVRAYFTLPL